MNAAERLWRAVGARDWAALRAQLHDGAHIERPASGERLTVDDFVAAHRARPAAEPVRVLRVAADGTLVAVEAAVGAALCAGFYDLHEARIQSATEYWVALPA